ncbi:MAG: hypothetical protein MZV70_67435 [Desulfobacterales bacterium]|nr:hypothetical protein [Desulfobacterales bacterium]
MKWPEATVHMMSHSFARGSTIFEVISFYATASGPAVFRLHEHIARLEKSAAYLDMELPGGHDGLCRAVAETVRRNRLAPGGHQGRRVLSAVRARHPAAAEAPGHRRLCAGSCPGHKGASSFPLKRAPRAGIARWRKLDPRDGPHRGQGRRQLPERDDRPPGRPEARPGRRHPARHAGLHRRGRHRIRLPGQGRPPADALRSGPCSTASRAAPSCRSRAISGSKPSKAGCAPALLFEADEVFFANTPFKVIPVRRIEDRRMSAVARPDAAQAVGCFAEDRHRPRARTSPSGSMPWTEADSFKG